MKKLFASFTLGRSINQFLCTLVILNMVFSSLRSGGVLATQMQPGNTLDILALSYVPNEIFIKVKPGIEVKATTSPLMAKASSSSSLNQILVVAGVESIMNPFYDRETLWQHIHKSPLPQPKDSVLSRWFKIKLRMQGNITETLKALEADPSVEAVDLNTFYYLNDGFPNDSKYSDQWGPKKIQLEPVWTYLTAGSPDVQVAVIDSGIDLNHPELADRYIYGRDYTSGTWTPTDERGHGTHVAGIIAALGNNGIGIAGAVWSSPVIIPLKVFTATGGTRNEWLAAATMDAADSQAKIINMSLGGEGMANRLGLLHDAIAYATDTKHKLVIAAAGNCAASNYSDNGCEHQNPEYYYPAAFPHVLAVAASTQNDGHADFSNHRIYVGVSAPGVRILSTLPTYDVALNQQWDCVGLLGLPKKCSHDYDSMDGTSMAAPFVSGVAALMLAVNPALRDADPDTLQNIIKQNADDVGTAGWDEFHGFGRLNAFKAVKAAMQVPPPPPTATPVSNGYDNAAFLSHITFPDGTVVSPGQSLIKTWRLRNTGTTTWDVGYQLVFISGEQMNAPSAVDVPNTAPGSTADISINLTAPTSQGEHTGYWRLRNPQGTYFGLKIRVKINVSDGTGGGGTGEISLTCLDCPAIVSPGYTFRPTIRATVHSGQLQGVNLRGDHLLNTDGNLFGAHPLIAITGNTIVNPNQSYNFTFYQDNPIHAPDTPGTYESKWRIWRGNNYAGQELTIRFEVRVGGGVNRAPNRPSLVSPTDWATFLSGGNISLQAQHNGDPDGDSINGYYFEVFTAGPIANSGWTSSNSWTPPSLGFENFQWRVKVRDQYNSESEWSEIRHFTVENNEPQIYSFYSMTCRPAWNQGEPEKICFCSDTNAGTQRLQVNTAPDGSENGEWIVLNEIGTPDYTCSSDNDRPPTWGHLSFDPGHYRVRLYARRDGGWAAAAHRDIFVDLTTDRRPDTPIGTPSNVYLNSQTVHFDWVDTKRTSSYRLIVSLNANLTNPLIDLTLPAGTSEYTHTFPSAYEMVYWNVKAIGPYGENGSGALFHIDVVAPQSAIAPLQAITDAENFTVNWSGTDDRSGIQWYAVQYREGNRPTSQWQDWLINTTRTNELFRGKLGETYYFRVRAMDQVGNWEDWPSGDGDAFVKIDPTAFPPPPYWNSAYANRRALTILNNDSDPIPAHYPLALHFDNTTSPTAADIYNASLSVIKCNDLRIVHNHQTELDRFVQYCSSSRVDLVFPAQTAIGGGQTSSGEYHLYYGNAAASSPPANLNNIFVPEADTNTMGLWHFQEGTGSTVYDSSGRGHHGTLTNANWADGYMGWAGRFNGLGSNGLVNIGHSPDFNTTATTVEAWFYWTGGGGWPPIVTKKYDGVSGGFEFRLTGDNHIRFLFNGVSWMHSSLGVQPNQWYHVAGVYNGYDRMYIYINGVEAGNAAAQPPSFGTAPVTIGYAQDGSGPNTFPGLIQHVRISNVARYDFPYARVGAPPTVVAGIIQTPPSVGTPDLSILTVATYPNIGGGLLVMATIQNMGTSSTRNTFATDLYFDHVPTNAGDYTGSVRFWVNDPIAAGSTVTLTTVITDLTGLSVLAMRPLAPLSESTGTLYAQVDSTGAVSETNNVNNIYSTGAEICVAAADMYENDDSVAMAAPAVLGQTRQHNFDGPTDRDWVSFIAQGGMTYTLRTLNLGPTADTYLYLYDANGTTLLASNDDAGGSLASQIDWTAPTTGTYYALVQHWNPNIGGCGTTYDLIVRRALTNKIYLPIVVRN